MAKDTSRTTAGELQKIVESWGQKTLKKKKSNSTYITTCCLGGLQEKKKSRKENAFTKKQTPAYLVIRHD